MGIRPVAKIIKMEESRKRANDFMCLNSLERCVPACNNLASIVEVAEKERNKRKKG